MKECCKTGDESSESNVKKWAMWLVWGIVVLLVLGIALKEFI